MRPVRLPGAQVTLSTAPPRCVTRGSPINSVSEGTILASSVNVLPETTVEGEPAATESTPWGAIPFRSDRAARWRAGREGRHPSNSQMAPAPSAPIKERLARIVLPVVTSPAAWNAPIESGLAAPGATLPFQLPTADRVEPFSPI